MNIHFAGQDESKLKKVVKAPVKGAKIVGKGAKTGAKAVGNAAKATPGAIKKTPKTTVNAVKSTPGAVKSAPKGVKEGFKAVGQNYKTTFKEKSLGRKILLVGTDLIGLVTLPLAVLPGPNFVAYISESARKFTGEAGKTIYEESGMKARMTDENSNDTVSEDLPPYQLHDETIDDNSVAND